MAIAKTVNSCEMASDRLVTILLLFLIEPTQPRCDGGSHSPARREHPDIEERARPQNSVVHKPLGSKRESRVHPQLVAFYGTNASLSSRESVRSDARQKEITY